jgi:hypothetical protein
MLTVGVAAGPRGSGTRGPSSVWLTSTTHAWTSTSSGCGAHPVRGLVLHEMADADADPDGADIDEAARSRPVCRAGRRSALVPAADASEVPRFDG